MRKLDHMELDLGGENVFEFYQLAGELNLVEMRKTIIDYCGYGWIPPNPK